MVGSVREAQDVIRSYGEGQNIIELRPLLFLHTTLNYFCCHTAQVRAQATPSLASLDCSLFPRLQEKEKVVGILRSFNWSAVNLSYSNVSCNLDHDNTTIYLLSILVIIIDTRNSLPEQC